MCCTQVPYRPISFLEEHGAVCVKPQLGWASRQTMVRVMSFVGWPRHHLQYRVLGAVVCAIGGHHILPMTHCRTCLQTPAALLSQPSPYLHLCVTFSCVHCTTNYVCTVVQTRSWTTNRVQDVQDVQDCVLCERMQRCCAVHVAVEPDNCQATNNICCSQTLAARSNHNPA